MKLNEIQIKAITESWYQVLTENNKKIMTEILSNKLKYFINDLRVSLSEIIFDDNKATMLLVGVKQFCPLKGNHSPVLAKFFNELMIKHELSLENFPYGAKLFIKCDGDITFEKMIGAQIIHIYSAQDSVVLPSTAPIIEQNFHDAIFSVIQHSQLLRHSLPQSMTAVDDKEEKQMETRAEKRLLELTATEAASEKCPGKKSKRVTVTKRNFGKLKFFQYNGPNKQPSSTTSVAENQKNENTAQYDNLNFEFR